MKHFRVAGPIVALAVATSCATTRTAQPEANAPFTAPAPEGHERVEVATPDSYAYLAAFTDGTSNITVSVVQVTLDFSGADCSKPAAFVSSKGIPAEGAPWRDGPREGCVVDTAVGGAPLRMYLFPGATDEVVLVSCDGDAPAFETCEAYASALRARAG